MDAKIIATNTSYATCAFGSAVVHIQRGTPTVETVSALRQATAHVLAHGFAKVAYLLIIEAASPPPPPEARDALRQLFNVQRERTIGYYVVAEGGGFRAATVRSVGIALSLLAPKAFPFVIEGTVTDLLHKLRKTVPEPSQAEFAKVVADLRSRMVPRSSLGVSQLASPPG